MQSAASPGESDAILAAHLFSGERLLWSGRPRRRVKLRRVERVGLWVAIIGLPIALANFWIERFLAHRPLGVLEIVALVALVVSLVIHLLTLRADRERRAHAVYGITNQRVMIASETQPEVLAQRLTKLDRITVELEPDGSGKVVVRPSLLPLRERVLRATSAPLFDAIEDAQMVCDLLRAARDVAIKESQIQAMPPAAVSRS